MKRNFLNITTLRTTSTLLMKMQSLRIAGSASAQPDILEHLVNDQFVRIILATLVELVLNSLEVATSVSAHLESTDIIVNTVS